MSKMPSGTRALIGTGFVGGNLLRQTEFDLTFNSKNIEDVAGDFAFIACAGAPAEKWKANQDPQGDRQSLDRLMTALKRATAGLFVLISTVDVYPMPVEVDEDSPIDPRKATPYGRHRKLLEDFVRDRFPRHLIVRLPALFGPGLKKNVVYDLIHDNMVYKIDPSAVFQFYDISRLWSDLQTALRIQAPVLNFATEPMSVDEILRRCFDRTLDNPRRFVTRYDVRSKYSSHWRRDDGYLYGKEAVLGALEAFARAEIAALSRS